VAKSDKRWLRRHVTDPYVIRAKAQGYRSRAAFKLIEINEKEKFLRPGATVVDLGAAPGSWSQVAAERVKPGGRVIAIDLLPLVPMSGVTILRGDFREQALKEKADVVLCDVSPNLSGIADVDQARLAELAFAAIDFCRDVLKPEGVFLIKAFHGEAFGELSARLKKSFANVKVVKPQASRGESRETYLVARGLPAL
jgi:23S rRNA (uridine2552-2'-O)-methyltransferase